VRRETGLAFIALGPASRVAVVDTRTFEVLRYIVVGQRPWHMELDPDGSKLYVANGLTDDIVVIDVATLRPLASTPVGRLPWGIAIKPQCMVSGSVQRIAGKVGQVPRIARASSKPATSSPLL
jgi:YVTN family beta-propeller protein